MVWLVLAQGARSPIRTKWPNGLLLGLARAFGLMFVDSHARAGFRKLLHRRRDRRHAGGSGPNWFPRGAHRSCRHRFFFVFWEGHPAGKVLMVLTLVVLVALAGALLPDLIEAPLLDPSSRYEATSGDQLGAQEAASL